MGHNAKSQKGQAKPSLLQIHSFLSSRDAAELLQMICTAEAAADDGLSCFCST
jgi:hypothetical protein